jgi:CheY-like chemotaxis protein
MPRKAKILFIDDDPGYLPKITDSVESLGFSFSFLSDSRKAIERFRKEYFDVVVTDIFMPGKNGFEIIKEIRACNKSTYVIALTGNPDKEVERKAFRHGADAFFLKPLDLEAFISTISSLQNGHGNEHAK